MLDPKISMNYLQVIHSCVDPLSHEYTCLDNVLLSDRLIDYSADSSHITNCTAIHGPAT